MSDDLIIGGHRFGSRFILGSGKFSLDITRAVIENGGGGKGTPAAPTGHTPRGGGNPGRQPGGAPPPPPRASRVWPRPAAGPPPGGAVGCAGLSPGSPPPAGEEMTPSPGSPIPP